MDLKSENSNGRSLNLDVLHIKEKFQAYPKVQGMRNQSFVRRKGTMTSDIIKYRGEPEDFLRVPLNLEGATASIKRY